MLIYCNNLITYVPGTYPSCDGSCSFNDDYEAVWINLTHEQIKENGIDESLIAGEKIILKKVTIEKNRKSFSLVFNNSSKLIVEY